MEGGSPLLGHLTQQNAGFYHPKTEKKVEVLSSKNDPTWRLSMLEPCKMALNMTVLSWALDGGTVTSHGNQ